MLEEESKIIFKMCKGAVGKTILNICSSDEKFYKLQQPFIWENLIKPLKRKNIFVNLDIKTGKGVDVIADCCNMYMVEDGAFDSVLFNSAIEHLTEPSRVVNEMRRILKKDGFAIFSAPGVYPRHNDPIDNMLRFPMKKSWELFLKDVWKIVEFRTTKPIPAKSFYKFEQLVFVSIVKCIPL